MSRFDDELTRTADNAWQNSGAPAPAQQGGYAQNWMRDPFAESFPTMTPPADDVADWDANQPARRFLQVTDLNASGADVMGGPGSSAVFASVDENLYQVYKASRQIRDAIEAGTDFDFDGLLKSASSSIKGVRKASDDKWLIQTTASLGELAQDVETELVNTGDYRQAYKNLVEFEGLLEEMNKYATGGYIDEDAEPRNYMDQSLFPVLEHSGDEEFEGPSLHGEGSSLPSGTNIENYWQTMGLDRAPYEESNEEGRRAWMRNQCRSCGAQKEDGRCDFCGDKAIDKKPMGQGRRRAKVETLKSATDNNGRHETLQHDDVRALDNVAPYMNVGPNETVEVTAPQPVNGEDAGYVPYYNDGAETGITPGQGPHAQEVFPYDQTNPAMVPYQGLVASREKIFEALQVVERLEKLGMVQDTDRAKHIAKFEQMSDAKLAGFKASLDMLEESGARQPRSQKVASGNNRMPEMGRLTTASTTTRQSLLADDWLMTL